MGVWYLSTTHVFPPAQPSPSRGRWVRGRVAACGADPGHGVGVASHHVRCRTEPVVPPEANPNPGPREPRVRGAMSTSALWTVRDIRHWSNPNYTRVVIDVDGEVQYRFGRLSNPDRLYVDLLGAQMDPQLQGRSLDVSDRYLKGVRGAQNQADVVRVVLDVKTLRDFHIFTID